jgi:hypothetical protein
MLGALDLAPSDIFPGFELWTIWREPWLMDLQWAEQFKHDRWLRAIDAPPIATDIPAPPQQPDN